MQRDSRESMCEYVTNDRCTVLCYGTVKQKQEPLVVMQDGKRVTSGQGLWIVLEELSLVQSRLRCWRRDEIAKVHDTLSRRCIKCLKCGQQGM